MYRSAAQLHPDHRGVQAVSGVGAARGHAANSLRANPARGNDRNRRNLANYNAEPERFRAATTDRDTGVRGLAEEDAD